MKGCSNRSHSWIGLAALAAGLVTIGLAPVGPAAQRSPQERESLAMRRVASALERGHLSGQRIGDAMSRAALDAYLDALDPHKLYFTQSDRDAMSSRGGDEIDDMLRAGDPRFVHAVFDRFKACVDARTELVHELLAGGIDVSGDAEFVTDPDLRRHAADPAELRELWRRRLAFELLDLEATGTQRDEAVERVRRRHDTVRRRTHQTRRGEVLGTFLSAVGSCFDPHTTYLTPRVLEDFRIQMRLRYQGIGARLRDEDGHAVIAEIMPGGAAEAHGGLAAGDRIVRIGAPGQPLEDVTGLRLGDVVSRIRGPEGTPVRLEILPAAGGGERVVDLVRKKSELRDQAARGEPVGPPASEAGGAAARVGVVTLPGFYGSDGRSAAGDVRALLDGFTRSAVDAVVLDLRFNGGGLLREAVGVTGLFIDRGPVVMVRGADGRVRTHSDRDRGVAWDGPLVVLTSRLSASASEIVAGAIQDYRRGLVVGDPATHGKGTVQHVMDLGGPALGALKLTVEQFYRPSGLSTQKHGVHADVAVAARTEALTGGEAELPRVLPSGRIAPAPHADYRLVNARLIDDLTAASLARRAESEDFAAIRRDRERMRAARQRTRVPLVADEFRAHRVRPDADWMAAARSERVVRDGYLDEVLAIARDYARQLETRRG